MFRWPMKLAEPTQRNERFADGFVRSPDSLKSLIQGVKWEAERNAIGRA